jgi:hypothetical protein
LFLPPGRYVLDRPLVIENTSGRDQGLPRIQGGGVGATILEAKAFAGAILSIRGVGQGVMRNSHFFHGGGLFDLEIRGSQPYTKLSESSPLQHGLDVLGWWGGTVSNVRISQLTGDGIRSVGDAEINPNPDFAASMLSLSNVKIERLAGWGFRDAHPIGSPAWVWERVLFSMCGRGGAWVRSSAHAFRRCSWNSIGFVAENTPDPNEATALLLGGPDGPTINRIHVVGCEFDSSKDCHLELDHTHACTVERTRFIHNDRNRQGRLTPPVAVVIARGGDRSPCSTTLFRQNLVRLDTPGTAAGFVWKATANVVDVEIDGLVVSGQPSDKVSFTPFVGYDDKNAHLTNDYRIRTREGIVSFGRPGPHVVAAIAVRVLEPKEWVELPLDKAFEAPFGGWFEVETLLVIIGGDRASQLELKAGGRSEDTAETWSIPAGIRQTVRWRERLLLTKGQSFSITVRVSDTVRLRQPGQVIARLIQG